uniref:GTP-binding protein Rhes n=1 Tax=Plectus sambesii TaxID=2011161 RepID=A0A914UIJ1_9BILA
MQKTLLARRITSPNMTIDSPLRRHKGDIPRLPSTRRKISEDHDAREGRSCPSSPLVKKSFRLVVLGSTQTGKSSLVARFLDDTFSDRYVPTIENFHRKMYKIKGELYQLDMLDTSGNDPFPAARRLSFISGDLFVLVSSTDLPASFEELFNYRDQIIDCKTSGLRAKSDGANVPIVMVLNKTDLPDNKKQLDAETCRFRVHELCGEASQLFECSAKTGENVDPIFAALFSMAKLPKQMSPHLHKLLRAEHSADGRLPTASASGSQQAGNVTKSPLRRMRSKFSKEGEEALITTYTEPVRRPSLRTDLFLMKTKSSLTAGSSKSPTALRGELFDRTNHKRCSIS